MAIYFYTTEVLLLLARTKAKNVKRSTTVTIIKLVIVLYTRLTKSKTAVATYYSDSTSHLL